MARYSSLFLVAAAAALTVISAAPVEPSPLVQFTPGPAIDAPFTPEPELGIQSNAAVVVSSSSGDPSSTSTVVEASPAPSELLPVTVPLAVSPAPQPINPVVFGEESPAPTNEGCVAIEHLEGHVLQHPVHLNKPVLCAHDFCATPNHAIIVDGVMTSMKRLCANEWKCIKTVKLVNNLRITANRRAVVSDRITVTAYDIRFPKIAIWVVQIAEQLFNALCTPAMALLAILGIGALRTRKSKM